MCVRILCPPFLPRHAALAIVASAVDAAALPHASSHAIVIRADSDMSFSACISCGQCVSVCPVGALSESTHWRAVQDALASKRKVRLLMLSVCGAARHAAHGMQLGQTAAHARTHAWYDTPQVMVVQTAPAVRVAIGEELGLAPGAVETGHLVSALRALGFDHVFDTDFSADLTILEEGTELLGRLKVRIAALDARSPYDSQLFTGLRLHTPTRPHTCPCRPTRVLPRAVWRQQRQAALHRCQCSLRVARGANVHARPWERGWGGRTWFGRRSLRTDAQTCSIIESPPSPRAGGSIWWSRSTPSSCPTCRAARAHSRCWVPLSRRSGRSRRGSRWFLCACVVTGKPKAFYRTCLITHLNALSLPARGRVRRVHHAVHRQEG